MRRRDFLTYGTAGAASAGLGLSSAEAIAQTACQPSTKAPTFTLTIGDVVARMVDGRRLNMLGFGSVPGPVLRVLEGSQVSINVVNGRPEEHAFEITNIGGSKIVLAAGCSGTVTFQVPTAGTYIYYDPSRGPLYRILGLHGVLVAHPRDGTTPNGSPTPYSRDKQTPAIQALFDAFGRSPGRFPGQKWQPAPLNEAFSTQERIWVLNSIDPKFNDLVTSTGIRPAPDVIANFVPRYFTINNRSGFDLHEGDDVVVKNYIGEPTLLRTVNVGLAHHYMHYHGNDLFSLAGFDFDPASPNFGRVVVQSNIFELDTHACWPMERRDILLPLEVPHEIPFRSPNGGATQFERMVAGQTQEPLPLRYVVHDHVEMSNTAAGGNYPQGMVTHWEILGGVGGRANASTATRRRTAAR